MGASVPTGAGAEGFFCGIGCGGTGGTAASATERVAGAEEGFETPMLVAFAPLGRKASILSINISNPINGSGARGRSF